MTITTLPTVLNDDDNIAIGIPMPFIDKARYVPDTSNMPRHADSAAQQKATRFFNFLPKLSGG